jgi:hypothetical protein
MLSATGHVDLLGAASTPALVSNWHLVTHWQTIDRQRSCDQNCEKSTPVAAAYFRDRFYFFLISRLTYMQGAVHPARVVIQRLPFEEVGRRTDKMFGKEIIGEQGWIARPPRDFLYFDPPGAVDGYMDESHVDTLLDANLLEFMLGSTGPFDLGDDYVDNSLIHFPIHPTRRASIATRSQRLTIQIRQDVSGFTRQSKAIASQRAILQLDSKRNTSGRL